MLKPILSPDAPDIASMSLEQIDEARRQTACLLAPALPFGAQGYNEHYMGIFGWRPPKFAKDEWIPRLFEEYEKGERRFLAEAFRGATKSTVGVGLATYILAKFPHYSVLIIQKSDDAATKTSASIANIIEFNTGWKTMYPNLVPDKDQRWSASGYEIKDTSIPYEEWRQKVLKERVKDPSFVGFGWESGSIVGMHPRALLIDDICDENNTRSEREMAGVLATLKSNILQTLNRPPDEDPSMCAVFFTPWYKNDPYAYLKATGIYKRIAFTPVVTEDENGFAWRGKKYKLAWGSMVKDPVKYLDDKLAEYGEMDFARMMLLNLEAAEGMNLKREWLHDYDHTRIGATWPVYFGVDYASSSDKIGAKHRDYFALSIGRVIPGGGVVLVDGFRDKLPQGDSEEKVKTFAAMYPGYSLIGFEKLGKGYDSMWNLINSGLRITPCPRQGERASPKGIRFEGAGGLGPLFQFSRVWISDAQTPYLKAFRDEWVQWPNGQHDDTLDATYWMLYVAQGFLMAQPETEQFGISEERKLSAFATLGSKLEQRRAHA